MDLAVRFGVAIPIVAVGLALSYAKFYERIWQGLLAVLLFLRRGSWRVEPDVLVGQGVGSPPSHAATGSNPSFRRN